LWGATRAIPEKQRHSSRDLMQEKPRKKTTGRRRKEASGFSQSANGGTSHRAKGKEKEKMTASWDASLLAMQLKVRVPGIKRIWGGTGPRHMEGIEMKFTAGKRGLPNPN